MLRFAITDLAGTQRAILSNFKDALVTIPYNDSRTAEVTISAENTAAAEALTLARMLKAWYITPPFMPELVFWGPIITPTWTLQPGARTLKIEAHDLSIRLKHHYLSGADDTIFPSPAAISTGYLGLRKLRDAGKNATAENDAGIPDLGIANGTNTHPGAFAYTYTTEDATVGDTNIHVEDTIGFPLTASGADITVVIDETTDTTFEYTGLHPWGFSGVSGFGVDIPAGSKVIYNTARTLTVAKGDEVWQRWLEIADDPFGPDFRLRPDDSTPGVYALLDTFDKRETSPGGTRDKRKKVVFQAGFGMDNVESFTYAPQGDAVRNRAVVVKSHTASDGAETTTTKVETNLASRIKYGNYVSWEALDSSDEVSLKGRAQATLLAYSEPPQQFTLTPRSDETQRFLYGRDFREGEVISCAAHFGQLRIWLPGFISEVRLRQKTASGQTQAEIDALPEIVNAQELGDGE